MMMARRLITPVLLLAVFPSSPAAQTRPADPPPTARPLRAFLTVGAGALLSNGSFDYGITFPLFAETGRIDTRVELNRAFVFEAGGGVWLWKRLGAGGSFVVSTADGTLASEITLPNPFLFDQPTTALARAPTRQTTREILIEGLVAIHESSRWLVVLSGGPSSTSLTQALASDTFRISYTFPFDTIDVTEVSGDQSTGRAWGGHVGMSVTWKAGARVGFDGRLRWSGASVDVEDLEGNRVTIDTGGLRVTGGVRVVF